MKKTFRSLASIAMVGLALVAAALPIATMAAAAGVVWKLVLEPFHALHAAVVNPQNRFALGANVLTNLAADIYVAADMIGREMVGIVPSIIVNSGAERAAKGDPIRSHFTRPATVNTSFAPSMTIPEGTDQTVDNKVMTIDNYASVQIPWTGEEMKHVNNGAGFETIYGDQILQAMRAIVNSIESGMWLLAYKAASRAWGTAGTTPFASNFNELPQLRKILVDNGCPFDGQLSVVMDTSAGANLRSLAQLQKANENASDALLRQGTLLDLQGFMLKESAGIGRHTAGTGSGYLINMAGGLLAGGTDVTVDTGTGTILAGDIATFAGTTHKYMVNTALAANVFSIGKPGSIVLEADNDAITVGASYTPNLAFHRRAIELAIRPPAQPAGGDAAVDSMLVQDPWSGLVFEVAAYKGYQKAMFDVRCMWGGKVWKPEFISVLAG